jgi:type I restriction enzyme S subunit
MKTVEFGTLFQFIRNGMSVKQDKSGDGLPVTRIETISNATVDGSRVGYAGLKEADCRGWFLENGDILFSHINSVEHIGKCAVYRGEPEKLVHGMNLLCLRCDKTKLIPEFAKYLIRGPEFRTRLANFTNKAVNQASVSIGNMKTIPVSVPPLAEQQRIAAILDAADALRAKRREALAQLDALLQSTFLTLFGDPVANPMGWERKKFSEIGSLDRGVSKHRPRNAPELLGGPYPLVQTGEIANCDTFIQNYKNTYSEIGLKQSKLWPAGTLCITIAANIAKTGILAFEACFPDSVVGFRSKDPATVHFAQTWLSFLQKMLEETAPESAQKNINLEILRNLKVPVPPLPLQQKFATIVESVERQKAAQRAHLAELDALFAALQHRAFRGEL